LHLLFIEELQFFTMSIADYTPTQRTRIFFFLIFSVAALWTVFLLYEGHLLESEFMFAFLVIINPVIAFIDIKREEKTRSFFFLYLIVLVALLWATFLLVLGVQLWISLLIFVICIGIPLLLHILEPEPETT